MMFRYLNLALFCLFLTALPTIAVDGADGEAIETTLSAFGRVCDYYESAIREKKSGVYEYEGILLIHSKEEIGQDSAGKNRSSSRLRAKSKAMQGAHELLRKWAAEQKAALREADAMPPSGIAFACRIVEQYEPNWHLDDWKIQLNMQTVYDDTDKNHSILCLAVNKKAALAAIPADYSQRCPADKLLRYFSFITEHCINSDKSRPKFLERCGVPDVHPEGKYDGVVAKEQEELQMRMEKYFSTSSFIAQIREEAKRAEPKVTTKETIEENPQKTRRVKTVVIVTAEEDIPRMQELLLSCGRESNTPCERIASGAAAIKALYDSKVNQKEKEANVKKALCENPGDKELWNYYGRLLLDRGETLAAVCCFRNALVLDRQFVFPMVNLSKAYKKLGCKEMSLGLALLAHGMAKDKWSLKETETLLFEK